MGKTKYLEIDHAEGYFDIKDYELFYRKFGKGDEVLITLHGGPGMPHDYLLPLAKHGSEEISVYFYDQFGVGRSDKPAPGDFDRYTIEHYRKEVEEVRRKIGEEKVHIYGQSWGGMLALEYVLNYPEHVKSLTLANSLVDTKEAFKEMRSYIEELSEKDQKKIEEYESKREFDSENYNNIFMKIYKEHVCRLDEYPKAVNYTFDNINLDCYGLMWGPNEYRLMDTARLGDWSVKARLDEIDTPTLVLTGNYDEISPWIAEGIAEKIPNSKIHVFDKGSHMPFWEQPEEHYKVLQNFLESNL